MKHAEWCKNQVGCISPGAKPCTMCEKAFNATTSKMDKLLKQLKDIKAEKKYAVGTAIRWNEGYKEAISDAISLVEKSQKDDLT